MHVKALQNSELSRFFSKKASISTYYDPFVLTEYLEGSASMKDNLGHV